MIIIEIWMNKRKPIKIKTRFMISQRRISKFKAIWTILRPNCSGQLEDNHLSTRTWLDPTKSTCNKLRRELPYLFWALMPGIQNRKVRNWTIKMFKFKFKKEFNQNWLCLVVYIINDSQMSTRNVNLQWLRSSPGK